MELVSLTHTHTLGLNLGLCSWKPATDCLSYITAFWVVVLSSLETAQRFRRTYCLHLHSQRARQGRNWKEEEARWASFAIQSWRLRQYGPLKHWAVSKLLGITMQNGIISVIQTCYLQRHPKHTGQSPHDLPEVCLRVYFSEATLELVGFWHPHSESGTKRYSHEGAISRKAYISSWQISEETHTFTPPDHNSFLYNKQIK
jgi:hypothetical protein